MVNGDGGRPVCVVTGGSAGIGLAVASHFAARGYRVALCGRDPQTLRAAEQQLAQTAPACIALALDIRDVRFAVNGEQHLHGSRQRVHP